MGHTTPNKFSLSEMMEACEGLTMDELRTAVEMYKVFRLQKSMSNDAALTQILNRIDKLERGLN